MNQISTADNLDDAVEALTIIIHEAALFSTPICEDNQNLGLKVRTSATAREMIRQSRRLRKIWQRTKNPVDKTNWNLAIKLCSEVLEKEKNQNLGQYLSKLRPQNKNKEHDLHRATKYLKRPVKRNVPIKNVNGVWCRSDEQKSTAFAEFLENTFKPNAPTQMIVTLQIFWMLRANWNDQFDTLPLMKLNLKLMPLIITSQQGSTKLMLRRLNRYLLRG